MNTHSPEHPLKPVQRSSASREISSPKATRHSDASSSARETGAQNGQHPTVRASTHSIAPPPSPPVPAPALSPPWAIPAPPPPLPPAGLPPVLEPPVLEPPVFEPPVLEPPVLEPPLPPRSPPTPSPAEPPSSASPWRTERPQPPMKSNVKTAANAVRVHRAPLHTKANLACAFWSG